MPAYLNPPKYVFIGTLSQTLTLRALVLIPHPPFNGAIRACGLSIATRLPLLANSGPASDDASLDDLFGAEEEHDKAQEHKQQVERLGTEIFLVKDDGAENEGNEDAAAPYH